MEFKRLENYRGFNKTYSDRIDILMRDIEERVTDKFALEYIQQLAEVCYLEGHKDGYHLADWLHYKTY